MTKPKNQKHTAKRLAKIQRFNRLKRKKHDRYVNTTAAHTNE